MTPILDAGALIALDRGDRAMWRRLKGAMVAGVVPRTTGPVVGQVWRGVGPRQALLARALDGVDVRPVDEPLGRAAGELLAAAGMRDVVDASLALLAEHGDALFTSDPGDLAQLAACAGLHVDVVQV